MLKIYKLEETAKIPSFATQEAACFDIYANIVPQDYVIYNHISDKIFDFELVNIDGKKSVVVPANGRALIPTGIILDIPKGYSVRIHPRSGNALKRGISLTNSEGIIDSDYRGYVMVLLMNMNSSVFNIRNGERIAQLLIEKNINVPINIGSGKGTSIKNLVEAIISSKYIKNKPSIIFDNNGKLTIL